VVVANDATVKAGAWFLLQLRKKLKSYQEMENPANHLFGR
jgi:hypothetical protein